MPARLLPWMVVLATFVACGGGPPTPLTRAAGAGHVREVARASAPATWTR